MRAVTGLGKVPTRSLPPVQQEGSIRFGPWQWRLPVPALTEHSPLGRMRLDPHTIISPNPSTSSG